MTHSSTYLYPDFYLGAKIFFSLFSALQYQLTDSGSECLDWCHSSWLLSSGTLDWRPEAGQPPLPAPPDSAWNPEIILIRELKKHIPVYVGRKWFLPTFQPFNMSDGILGIVILSCNSYKWIHIFLGVILQTFFKEYENNGTLHRKFEQFFRRATW